MKKLAHPLKFNAQAFRDVAGYGPESAESGFITNCPDSMTQEQMDGMVADNSEQLIDQIWAKMAMILDDPRWGVNGFGAAILEKGKGQNAKADAVLAWAHAIYAEAMAKETAVLAGQEIDLEAWPARKKPHAINTIRAELGI